MSAKSKILDCTLRDGGYYNNWDFEKDKIESYVNAVSKLGVEWIEIGFRSKNKNGFRGACAYSTDKYISALSIDKSINYGVMVNATEFIEHGSLLVEVLEELFPNNSNQTLISFVRIAFYASDLEQTMLASEILKNKGFVVMCNLMQAGTLNTADISAVALRASMSPIDALYFADSVGGMNAKEIERVISAIRVNWKGDIGIHAHDNMGMALQNTLAAMNLGCTWLDSTIAGLGRGAGNAKTEILAIELAEINGKKIDLLPVIELIKEYIGPIREISKEFESIYYYLSGKFNIHPTYIQEMLSDARYSIGDMLSIVNKLKEGDAKTYTLGDLNRARYLNGQESEGEWNPVTFFNARDVLVLGSGEGALRHKFAIETYIKNHKPLVISLNLQTSISKSLIDYIVICHPLKLATELDSLLQFGIPIVAPAQSYKILEAGGEYSLKKEKILDFGLKIDSDCQTVKYDSTSCTLRSPVAAAYAFAIACSGGANQILLAGFDGYEIGDMRQAEMDQVIELHGKAVNGKPLVAITPTKYALTTKSIYGLL